MNTFYVNSVKWYLASMMLFSIWIIVGVGTYAGVAILFFDSKFLSMNDVGLLLGSFLFCAIINWFYFSGSDKQVEKIEIKNNQLTGSYLLFSTKKSAKIDLACAFKISQHHLITFPFKTYRVKQNEHQVWISNIFLSEQKANEAIKLVLAHQKF